MAYLSEERLQAFGFKYLGKNVQISDKAAIYNPELIEIGDHSRIDDFCIVSGRVVLGRYCHITPMCLVAGGKPGIYMDDYTTCAYGVKIFSQSDDYSGETMVNSLIPKQFKKELFAAVYIKRHVIIGTNAVIFPGVTLEEGTSVGAMSLVTKSTQAWWIYMGIPAKPHKVRSQNLLTLEKKFKASEHDSI